MEQRLSMSMTGGVAGHIGGYCNSRLMGIVGVGEGGWTVDTMLKRSVQTRHLLV